jgi:hypothetical protein
VTRKPYEIHGLSLVVLAPEGGPSAIAFLTRAEEYLAAAEKLVPQEGFLPKVGEPESLLTGIALELSLKSFLLACGVPIDYLKEKIGHKLRKLLKDAEEKGIGKVAPISAASRGAVDLLSNEYSGKHLEYFQGTGRVARPDLRQLLPEIRNVYEALDVVYVNASKAERAQRNHPGGRSPSHTVE